MPSFQSPEGFALDKNRTIYVADGLSECIVQWRRGATKGNVVAGGNGLGNKTHQLNRPADVIVDEGNNSLIIADYGNKRVVRWISQSQQEVLLENISAYDLATDKYGYFYVCDREKNEVRRWKMADIKGKQGVLVAGGNGKGKQLNQLDNPTFIFIDNEQSVYVSDRYNDRVMKWKKDAKEGTIVAGGNRQGSRREQLDGPGGVIVDDDGQVYVADSRNNRIMGWKQGAKEGEVILKATEGVPGSNEFQSPTALLLDSNGNLYITDSFYRRILRFDLITQ